MPLLDVSNKVTSMFSDPDILRRNRKSPCSSCLGPRTDGDSRRMMHVNLTADQEMAQDGVDLHL